MDVTSVILIGSVVLGLLAVFLVILVALYNNRQRVFKQERELLHKSYENRIIQSKLEIADDTAQKISRALHDNIGQKLSAAKLLAGSPGISSVEIKSILGEVINDVRDLSKTLKSEPKINKGLLPGLTYLADLLEKQGIKVNTKLSKDEVFDQAERLSIYRVCQEVVQNILKHANANEVSIEYTTNKNSVDLTITDNGRGYNIEDVNKGSGLDNIKARCEEVGAKIKITSEEGRGCIITVTKNFSHE